MSAGAPVRLPPIAVKLNGETAKTKPSSGRYSSRFQTPGPETGCSSYIRVMKAGLKRQKSISSQAASISAWCAVFDWPSIVAALSVSRHGPASSSAARRKIAARSSQGTRSSPPRPRRAALIAASTSAGAALVDVGEDVLLRVRHDRLARLAGAHLLAADDQRDVEPLVPHLLEPQLQARALRRSRRVVLDRLVHRRRNAEDARGAHAGHSMGVGMDVVAYDVPAWGVGELYFRERKLLYHELPRAGSASRRAGCPSRSPSAWRRTSAASASRFDDVELEWEWATPFQEALALALREVPWGEVVTYGELAALAGRPGAPRAAGTFCADEQLPARRALPPGGLVERARRLRLARRRVQAPAARARGRRALSLSEDVRERAGGDRAAQGLLPAGRAVGARARRRAASTCAAAGASRSTSSWPAARWRGGRSRSCAPTASPARSARTGDARSSRERATSSTSRTMRARLQALNEAGVARREPRAAGAAAAAGRRAALLPGGVPARRLPRGGLGERPAERPPRAAHRGPRLGALPRRAGGGGGLHARRLRAEPSRGRLRARARRRSPTCSPSSARRTPRCASARRPSSRRRAPGPTGSPTPTTRTSSARAAPRTSSSAPSAGSSARGGSTSWRPSWRRSRACASAIRRCPCASWPAAATRRPRRRPRTAGWCASSGWPSCSTLPGSERAGGEAPRTTSPSAFHHAPDRGTGRGLYPAPDERRPAPGERNPRLGSVQDPTTRNFHAAGRRVESPRR